MRTEPLLSGACNRLFDPHRQPSCALLATSQPRSAAAQVLPRDVLSRKLQAQQGGSVQLRARLHADHLQACDKGAPRTRPPPVHLSHLRAQIPSQPHARAPLPPACRASRSPHPATRAPPPPQIFLGRLRESENERVVERMWHGMMEIVISWSMFGQAVDASFLVYMAALACLKALHWLVQDRINFMQTEPRIGRVQHARTVSCLALLMARPARHPTAPHCAITHCLRFNHRGSARPRRVCRRSMWPRCGRT